MTENSLSRFDQLRADLKAKKAKKAAKRAANQELAAVSCLNVQIAKDGTLKKTRPTFEQRAASLALKLERSRARKAKRRALGALDKASGKKRVKLPSVKKLRAKLWDLVAEYVKKRDAKAYDGKCITCQSWPIFSANHIVPKSDSLNLYYDPENLYGGCIQCNRSEVNRRSHWALVKFPAVFGHEKMLALAEKSKIRVKWGRPEFMEKIAAIEAKLEQMKEKSKEA